MCLGGFILFFEGTVMLLAMWSCAFFILMLHLIPKESWSPHVYCALVCQSKEMSFATQDSPITQDSTTIISYVT
jgi:hypothetical protein